MGKQILRRNTNDCDINARPPVNSNGKEGVAMKQLRSSDRSFPQAAQSLGSVSCTTYCCCNMAAILNIWIYNVF